MSSRSQPAGAGCAASTSATTFDTAGNALQSDDFNGNRTCKSFDSVRNLELTRFEGLGTATACSAITPSTLPAGARMVSSQWHPDWPIAARAAEPRRITTLVYNGQPDPTNGGAVATCAPSSARLPDNKPIVVLCKRVEQATTDESGSRGFDATAQAGVPARATSWTYNETGQVLTEKDPRGKVAVSNEYYTDTTASYTKGDLKSSTNALGQVTRFLRYDAYGKPLEVVDAGGVSTTYVYDARQRLLSTTSGAETSSYEYWPNGLLKKSTQPDGLAVSYEYDDAHRLIAAFASLVSLATHAATLPPPPVSPAPVTDYEYDAKGNPTKVIKAKGVSGFGFTSSNSYDTLDRVKDTTDARNGVTRLGPGAGAAGDHELGRGVRRAGGPAGT